MELYRQILKLRTPLGVTLVFGASVNVLRYFTVLDFSKSGMNCNNENPTIKYSEDVKSINDVIPCNTTIPNSSINNNVVNANWNCTVKY